MSTDGGNEDAKESDSLADEVDALLKALAPDRKCHVCGHDWWWIADNKRRSTKVPFVGPDVVNTYTFICGRCGVITQHARDVLHGLIKEPDDRART